MRSPSARAPKQRALLAWLKAHRQCDDRASPRILQARRSSKPWRARGWIAARRVAAVAPTPAPLEMRQSDVTLTRDQTAAVEAILATLSTFAVHLLYGVTGSGKTEVYLRVIAAAVAAGGQALVLVPEIALTPQLVDRFRRRFSAGVAVVHSGLTDSERRDAWRAAHSGAGAHRHRHPLRRFHAAHQARPHRGG